MAQPIAFLNGRYIPFENASIHLTDLGVTRGYAVFDLAATEQGVPFMLDEHIARLKQSVRAFYIKTTVNAARLKSIIRVLLKKNGYDESVIRIMITGGSVFNRRISQRATFTPIPTLAVYTEPLKPFAEKCYTHGIQVVTTLQARNDYRVKSVNYSTVFSLLAAHKKAKEILYVPHGKVLEGGTSNFFMFKKNVLVTARDGVLHGVTRGIVLKLARKYYKVEKRELHTHELRSATEAFMTATIKNVMPVVRIDAMRVGSGYPGKNTKSLMEDYRTFVQAWVARHRRYWI